jgi:hypothetical protein
VGVPSCKWIPVGGGDRELLADRRVRVICGAKRVHGSSAITWQEDVGDKTKENMCDARTCRESRARVLEPMDSVARLIVPRREMVVVKYGDPGEEILEPG